jgi:hypothetical protein
MPYLSENVFFVHVPRTGGATVGRNFIYLHEHDGFPPYNGYYTGPDNRRYVPAHMTVEQIVNFNLVSEEKFKDLYSCAVVRNPWDRAVSSFYSHGRSTRRSFDNYLSYIEKQISDNPKLTFTKGIVDNLYVSQKNFLSYNGKILVKDVYLYENYDKMIKTIVDKVNNNLKIKMNHNVSDGKNHYTEYYKKDTRNLIQRLYQDDIDYFGFEYGK